jgi:hypothetical protein
MREAQAISVPAGETRVLKHFQERMPYGAVWPHQCRKSQTIISRNIKIAPTAPRMT